MHNRSILSFGWSVKTFCGGIESVRAMNTFVSDIISLRLVKNIFGLLATISEKTGVGHMVPCTLIVIFRVLDRRIVYYYSVVWNIECVEHVWNIWLLLLSWDEITTEYWCSILLFFLSGMTTTIEFVTTVAFCSIGTTTAGIDPLNWDSSNEANCFDDSYCESNFLILHLIYIIQWLFFRSDWNYDRFTHFLDKRSLNGALLGDSKMFEN